MEPDDDAVDTLNESCLFCNGNPKQQLLLQDTIGRDVQQSKCKKQVLDQLSFSHIVIGDDTFCEAAKNCPSRKKDKKAYIILLWQSHVLHT